MPIYEYQCQACGKVNEVIQKVGDDAPDACEACAKGPLTKILSKTGFILKGSGWYVTDFRGGSNNSSSNSSNSSSGSSSSSSSDAPSSGSSEGSSGTSKDSGTSKTETKAAGGCGSGCGHSHH